MADFIGDKRAEPRKLLGTTVRKQGSPNKEEHPIAMLRRVARDFAAGVSALSRLAPSQPSTQAAKALERHTEKVVTVPQKTHTEIRSEKAWRASRLAEQKTHQHTSRETSNLTSSLREISRTLSTDQLKSTGQLKEKQAGFSFKPIVTETAKPLSYTGLRVPTPRISAPRARPVRTSRASRIAAEVDREARRHLDSPATAEARELPSAARLAQIMRADQLMRSGEVRPHQQVSRWASAIRAGKRREIADLDPERVERILHESVGGREAATRLLSTPEINQLIDRHHSTLSTVQSSLRETEKVLERTAGRRAGQVRTSQTTTAERAHLVAPRDYTGLAAPTLPTPDQRTDTAQMSEMLANNEEPHLYAESGERRQMMQTQALEGRHETSTGERASQPEQSRSRPMSGATAAPARREVASAISAPPQRSVQTSTEMSNPNQTRKKERMELSGTMTLVSRGQNLGDMRVQAELR